MSYSAATYLLVAGAELGATIWIMRPHMRVDMTAGESLKAMVEAMEDAGYLYTPFVNSRGVTPEGNTLDYLLGPDTHHLKIQEKYLFAFEYMVHMNIAERPGYPLCFNISNPQVITSRGVEYIQPPNEEIVLIH